MQTPQPDDKPTVDETLVTPRVPTSDMAQTLKTDPVPYVPEVIRVPRSQQPIALPTQPHQPRVSAAAPLPPRESAVRQRTQRRQAAPRRKGGEWAWVVIAVAMMGVALTTSLGLFALVRAANTPQTVLPTATALVANLPTPVAFLNDGGLLAMGQAITFDDGTRVVLEPWDGQSRLTVLMMGIDRRPGETGLSFRTDTLILLSLDPRTGDIGMLSIPRDMWVSVPGYGERRVNEPMVLGELRQQGYGPRLAMETVQYNLGIRVNHYLVVDFAAFITIVNALGGIDVDVPYTINDPLYPSMNYGYDPFFIRAGNQTLDGATALKYARTRHGDSDIRRAERQQQVIMAIRDKATRAEMIPALLANASGLWASVRDNVYTDLTLEQMVQLALFVKDIPFERINRGVIDYRYLSSFTTAQGASVLIPNRARLGGLMSEVFGANYAE
jgi:LCP family protein required for cell wall assembly